MDILPINNVARIVEQARHDDREQPRRRQPQPKREKFAAIPVYTPEGGLEETPVSKIDVVA